MRGSDFPLALAPGPAFGPVSKEQEALEVMLCYLRPGLKRKAACMWLSLFDICMLGALSRLENAWVPKAAVQGDQKERPHRNGECTLRNPGVPCTAGHPSY